MVVKVVHCSLRIYPYKTYQLTPFNFSKSFRRISVQSRVFRHPRTYKQTRVSTCCPSTKIARDAGKIHMHDPRARLRSSSSYNKSDKTRYAHVSQNPRCLAFPRIRSLQDMKMIKMTAREPYKSKSCERGLNFRCLVSKLHGNATMLSHGVTCCPLHSQLLVHSPRKFASRSGAPYATLPEIHGPGMKSCQLDVSAVK